MAKNKGGRPVKYRKKYCGMMVKFFEIEPFREVEVKHKNKKGEEWVTYEDKPNRLPTFERFASLIGVSTDTINNWADAVTKTGKPKYPEFLGAYKRCKELQKNFLIENGVTGLYNPVFTIFVAKNITDMKDKQEVDNNISGGLTIERVVYENPNKPKQS